MIPILVILLITQTEEEPGGARIEEEPELEATDRAMEDIEEAETPEVPASKTSTPAATVAGCPPNIDAFYNQGFDDLVQGDTEGAYAMFTRVMDLCPKHPLAAEMARLALTIPSRKTLPARADPTDPAATAATTFDPEKPSLLARGELVTFQSVHGLAAGLSICVVMQCEDGRAVIGLAFLGTAALGGLSFALSSDIRPGQALMVNSGTAWGLWHAALFAGILEPEAETAGGMVVGLGLLGTGVGASIAYGLKPNSGDVSLANSIGIWTGVLSLFAMNAAEIDPFDDEEFWPGELVATDLGLALGAVIATRVDISRGRVLLIDAGGIAGLLLGLGIAVLATEEPDQPVVGGMGLVGTAFGLATTFYLSRNLDAPDVPEQVMLLPGGPKGSLGGTLAVAF